ncbi:MAG: hypothetical protein ACTHLW_01205, partial [Verrucomicrobiota bacterium]
LPQDEVIDSPMITIFKGATGALSLEGPTGDAGSDWEGSGAGRVAVGRDGRVFRVGFSRGRDSTFGNTIVCRVFRFAFMPQLRESAR